MQLPVETEALVVNTPGGDFEMTPIVIQDLRPDEVLVEMKYSGVCHTVCISHTPGQALNARYCNPCSLSS